MHISVCQVRCTAHSHVIEMSFMLFKKCLFFFDVDVQLHYGIVLFVKFVVTFISQC